MYGVGIKPLKTNTDKYGYERLFLNRKTGSINLKAHRVVVECCDQVVLTPDQTIDHLDGVKNHNRRLNLEVVTAEENSRRMYQTGLNSSLGENNNLAKLTEESVLNIRSLKQSGVSFDELANMFNVSKSCVAKVVYRQTWTHL